LLTGFISPLLLFEWFCTVAWSGVAVVCHRDDDFPSGVACAKITERFTHLT